MGPRDYEDYDEYGDNTEYDPWWDEEYYQQPDDEGEYQ